MYQDHPERLFKYRLLGPIPSVSDPVDIELYQKMSVSYKFISDSVDLATNFENHYTTMRQYQITAASKVCNTVVS